MANQEIDLPYVVCHPGEMLSRPYCIRDEVLLIVDEANITISSTTNPSIVITHYMTGYSSLGNLVVSTMEC